MNHFQQELNENGLVFDIESLYDYLLKVRDTRKAKGKRHMLISLLILMLLAKPGGENKPSGMADWIIYQKKLWVRYGDITGADSGSIITLGRKSYS